MIEINLLGKKYKIPDINEITISQYLKMKNPSDELQMLSDLCGVPVKDLEKAPRNDILSFIVSLTDIYNTEAEKVNVKDIPEKVIIEDQEFIVPKDIGNETSGQWWDMSKLITQIKDSDELMLPIMAIYLKKEGEKYDSDRKQERIELFRKAKMVDVIKVHTFFLMSDKEYSRLISTRLYQMNPQMRNTGQESNGSTKSGVTLSQSIPSHLKKVK